MLTVERHSPFLESHSVSFGARPVGLLWAGIAAELRVRPFNRRQQLESVVRSVAVRNTRQDVRRRALRVVLFNISRFTTSMRSRSQDADMHLEPRAWVPCSSLYSARSASTVTDI